jgi:SanA protein
MKMIHWNWKRVFVVAVVGLLTGVVLAVAVNIIVVVSSSAFISDDLDKMPSAEVGLILGARVLSDGRLSHMMQDRADAAVELYESGKVKKLIMSGDHGTKTYDEVNTVKKYLLEKGVRAEDLFLDHAGFDTYDSLYRARDIFGAHSVIVVTQKFHEPRAVFIGRSLGMDVHGYIADKREYQGILWNEFREIFSRTKAGVDVVVGAKPKFLGEKIPLDGDSQLSWD